MKPRELANKYLCKICNIWIADNKPQRDQHENGQKHKSAKVKLLKDIAKKNDALRRAAGKPILSNTATQQLLETVAQATKVDKVDEVELRPQIKTEGRVEEPDEEPDEKQDDSVFPAPADQVYVWTEVSNREGSDGPEVAQDDYMTNKALGEFAPDEERNMSVREDHEERTRSSAEDGTSVSKVAENEDPEERQKLQGTFKKRAVPKNRRKRRVR